MQNQISVSDQAFVTLATNDVYCQGALVLGQSLREHRATRRLVVLVTPQVSNPLRVILSRVFDEVIEVNLIDSADYVHLAFLKRPDLGITLTKLHCWTLTHYSKCVFLDADTLSTIYKANRFGSSAKVVHFLGSSKPWTYKYNPQTGSVLEEGSGRADQHQTSFLNQWWGIYHRRILPLCENIRNKDHQGSPGHTCSGAAATAEGSCANPAEGPRQACSADGSEKPVGVEENIPTLAARPSEEVSTYALHGGHGGSGSLVTMETGDAPWTAGRREWRNLSSGCSGVS
ncbi:hypothetical protein Celaphus_00010148, partial [Cervus elaphus hippelaphus]